MENNIPNYNSQSNINNNIQNKSSESNINDNQNNLTQSNEINNLKNELDKANKIIEQQNLTINKLQNKLNNLNNSINQKDILINALTSQINDLKLNNNNAHNNIQNTINFSDVLCINFMLSDQNVPYAVTCLKTDIFAEIEEKLYKKYPEYRETNNNFIVNEREILRFKTIDENKIGNGLPVTLIPPA